MNELFALVQIVAIDALMAADNAIVVGMAASAVPAHMRRKTILYGTAAAVVLRILFALLAVQLLKIIGLTFAGGLLLVYVVYDMYQELRGSGGKQETTQTMVGNMSMARAVGLVIIADVSMSLDNVLAVAGAANGNLWILSAGLLISVILMASVANVLASVIHKHKWVAWIGLLIVAYIAVSMIWRGSHEVSAFFALGLT